jgi:hypothetical protein
VVINDAQLVKIATPLSLLHTLQINFSHGITGMKLTRYLIIYGYFRSVFFGNDTIKPVTQAPVSSSEQMHWVS